MEAKQTYINSLNYINTLNRANATDKIEIDYTKLDSETKKALKDNIQKTLNTRSREINNVILGAE